MNIKKTLLSTRSIILILAILFLSGVASKSALGANTRVLILPFEMHGTTDLSKTRRVVMETMAATFSAEGAELVGIKTLKDLVLNQGIEDFDEERALSISDTALADYAILGSITKIGETTNVDWRLFDLHRKKILTLHFKSDENDSALLTKIRNETKKTYLKMASTLGKRPVEDDGIVDIISVVGNMRVDDAAVLKKVKSKTGEPFNPDFVKEDITNIFGMGYFDNVLADYSVTASGLELKFVVEERPYLKSISYSGNDEVDLELIEETVTLKKNTILDRVLIKENAEAIEALYASEGFYLATVTPELTRSDPDVGLTFNIDEGKEVRVKKITIIGNDQMSDHQLLKAMKTKRKGFFSRLTGSGKFDQFQFQSDLNSIVNFYFDNGYIKSDIVDQSVQLSEDKRWFYITIAIIEGDQYTTGEVNISGDILNTRTEIIDLLQLKRSDVFNRSKLSAGMEKIRYMYGDEGYGKADITPSTSINEENKTLDIDINISKNDLIYIERIDISGNTRTRDKVIRREVEISEGDLYSSSGLKRSKNSLKRLGFFEDVNFLESPGTTPDKLKLDLEVTERPTGAISAGLGYSTVDKMIITGSVSQANFMGTGIKLEISATLSDNSNNYVLSLTEPWLFDKPISAGFDLYNTKKEYPDFDMEKQGGSIRFGFPILRRYTRGYLTYKYEDVDVSDVEDSASFIIKEQEGMTTVSSIRAYVKHDTRNDAFFPTEGYVMSNSIEVAGGVLGGTTSFAKYEVSGQQFIPMPWNTSLSIRGMIGYVHGYDGQGVPIYERYFLGGISTIRGFATREVGPQDNVGEYIGGETMILMNLEYIFPVFTQKSVRGVAFYDMGNAYDGPINMSNLRHGAGLGIRWFSPVGPIRLELGFNLDPRDGEEPQQWEFAIGTTF
ncbi:MAG: outer membrane protein assembly factor BamA [Proteobacteria bacterium]|nr:outer membrane protein assembly factor BamA [Pseudomonadota bacterium]